ncbi:FAD-dependent oxidoreductase [Salarchaeum sp. JOR-1]|uniref:FAD-dependent oxidoreductase n=1 Tax=Salarchaeum sp. JOR-1 TaxID=2599399 RepID=UPI0011989B66|nr:FAD-dependent oxidoreductase [Salarchaeum sp. JOR-1]QDX41037.1 FAD-dependent oxidoreductase [Salarchaeum sp. JOR-1]
MDTEVLVVGGGATGVGVARDLAMRGVDVVLAERGGLNAGTSGRSHGLLHSGARYAEHDPDGAQECIRENRVLKDIAGDAVRDTRGLFVQLDGDDPGFFDEKLAACRDLSIPATVYDGDAARDLVPGLPESVERTMDVPDAVIYPSRLVAATAASAREHGATVLTHTPIEGLLTTEDGVVGASTAEGEIRAEHVVNATGAWAGRLARTAGIDLEMTPTKGAMVTVEYDGLDTVLNRCRPPADGDIVVPHEEAVVLGTTSVEVDDPDDFPEGSEEVERMRAECADLLPAVADAPLDHAYWGVRPLYEPSGVAKGRGISRGFFVLDHAERDGVPGLTSVVGGKLTTYRLMAEATADHVTNLLGVDAACRTAEERLPGADDAEKLDSFVREFDAGGPADADVLST